MGRTNPLALRLRGVLNWPSNVRHQLLTNYVKHIFQHTVHGEPHIRASTTGIWVNFTVLAPKSESSETHPLRHPKVENPTIDFRNAQPLLAPGREERRVKSLANRHKYFKDVLNGLDKSQLEALGADVDPQTAMQIFKDTPVHLKINIITNPLMDAQVCAHYVAKCLSDNKPISKVYKTLLANLG
ncbi:hypothetical protein BC832DRAFT_549083 [Gaertneriomyces semiglobifer]|nr:hypothetical protein BC832DRAFT_549083 [Gaertneriomyces semiglobifer]